MRIYMLDPCMSSILEPWLLHSWAHHASTGVARGWLVHLATTFCLLDCWMPFLWWILSDEHQYGIQISSPFVFLHTIPSTCLFSKLPCTSMPVTNLSGHPLLPIILCIFSLQAIFFPHNGWPGVRHLAAISITQDAIVVHFWLVPTHQVMSVNHALSFSSSVSCSQRTF